MAWRPPPFLDESVRFPPQWWTGLSLVSITLQVHAKKPEYSGPWPTLPMAFKDIKSGFGCPQLPWCVPTVVEVYQRNLGPAYFP